ALDREPPVDRLVRPMPHDGAWGWLGSLFAGAVAALLRLVDLGRPAKLMFDETYYAKDALSLLRFADARSFVEGADEKILAGDLDVFTDQPSFVVHPNVGKWLIALGIRLAGMEPVGWRLAPALAGVITVIVVARAGRRLFRSTLLGTTAGLLIAVDGMSITLSRTAILDGLLAMFVAAAFACLLVDRDWARARYAAALRAGQPLPSPLAWRPWRLAAGILLGLACGTKWNGLYVLAVFGVMTVLWELSARRVAGDRAPVRTALLADGPVAFLTMLGSAAVVYVASWAGWIAGDNGWSRQWAASNPASGLAAWLPDWVRSLWHYHGEMWHFHSTLQAQHDYASDAWSWLLLTRPVSFDYTGLERGEQGCDVDQCSQAVLALGTPVLWWGACLAVLVCEWMWLARRDWRPGAILAGVLATWVPWLFWPGRTTFAFYAVVIAPFLVLAVTYVLGLILGPPGADRRRRTIGAAIAGGYVLLVVVVAAWFYPIHVDAVIPYDEWLRHMWFRGPGTWKWI
ncbi:MAG: phospholipid carrier-dependent glycosyltransferase, partial [Jiangellaceae bacterium]|nr:phospholipid carrier-dependent glycosyltransferase [Jiangellaceae bacterium]